MVSKTSSITMLWDENQSAKSDHCTLIVTMTTTRMLLYKTIYYR